MLRKFFSSRHNFAPKGPFLGAKNWGKFAGPSEISWNIRYLEVAPIYFPKVQESSGFFWIFRRGAQDGDHFCFKALTIYLSFTRPTGENLWRFLKESAGTARPDMVESCQVGAGVPCNFWLSCAMSLGFPRGGTL